MLHLITFAQWVLALYHRACIRSLQKQLAFHMKTGVPTDHPHVLGLYYALQQHNEALARLGYCG